MQPSEVDYVIYHAKCPDGIGSALAAWTFFSDTGKPAEAGNPLTPVRVKPIYYAAKVGSEPPSDLDGKNVLICDFSYRKDVLLRLLQKVKKLLVIDHHKSSEKDLADIPAENKWFDVKHSGAYLTWKYFFPSREPPLLARYIEDHDIWLKKMPHTEEFSNWLIMVPPTFESYSTYLDDSKLLAAVTSTGRNYWELNEFYIEQALDYTVVKCTEIKGKIYFIAYNNMAILKSELGNRCFTKFPLIDFSAIYNISDQSEATNFSLRSTDEHIDVSTLAFSLGGGGHRNASGLQVGLVTNRIPGRVLDIDYHALENIKISTFLGPGARARKVVSVPHDRCKHALGKYLLQNKHDDKQIAVWLREKILRKTKDELLAEKVEVQLGSEANSPASLEAKACAESLALVIEDASEREQSRCEMAVVWNYNAAENKTYWVFAFDSSLKPDDVKDVRVGLKLDEKDRLVQEGLVRF